MPKAKTAKKNQPITNGSQETASITTFAPPASSRSNLEFASALTSFSWSAVVWMVTLKKTGYAPKPRCWATAEGVRHRAGASCAHYGVLEWGTTVR